MKKKLYIVPQIEKMVVSAVLLNSSPADSGFPDYDHEDHAPVRNTLIVK